MEESEAKKALEAATVKAKSQEEVENIEDKHKKVLDNLGNIYADRLRMKAAELDAIEKALDEKIAGFKEFVNKTAVSGKGVIALEKTQKELEEEKRRSRMEQIKRSIGR